MKKINLVDDRSIRVRFWLYFSGLAVFILILLWLLQIVFINSFYQTMKIREVEKAGTAISNEFGDSNFEDLILNYSFQKGFGVQVYNDNGSLVYPVNPFEIYYQPRMDRSDFNLYFKPLLEKNLKSETYVEPYEGTETSSILYVAYLGEISGDKYFLTVTTILDPVDTTVDILKNQLIIVSIISIVLAFILSFFLSKRLAAPLTEMAKTARELGEGNLEVSFPKSTYTEINDLARTLNFATGEINKTLEVRKDLIANVSHDLKTPLTVIKSYGEMIRDISGDDPELREEHINIIIQESDYLTTFVNDLLNLSKIESELEDLQRIPFSLKRLTREVLKRFKLLMEEDGYDIEIVANTDGYIIGDPSKIRQAIYNFISNAINYSRKEKRVVVSIMENEGEVKFSVQDTGVGIAKEQIPYIWDRYYRARDNYERQVVGTGLGLYICKNVLELHGFKYGVDSELGKGSTFYFYAPCAEEK